MEVAGINKHISFHCSRHTFATNCLNLGIKMPVIRDLLGHKDLKTTAIYVKVADPLKNIEMEKWNI